MTCLAKKKNRDYVGKWKVPRVRYDGFTEKNKAPIEFHVTRGFDSRESESLYTSPPLDMAMHPLPTLARFISPLRPGIGTFLSVRACRPPQGAP